MSRIVQSGPVDERADLPDKCRHIVESESLMAVLTVRGHWSRRTGLPRRFRVDRETPDRDEQATFVM